MEAATSYMHRSIQTVHLGKPWSWWLPMGLCLLPRPSASSIQKSSARVIKLLPRIAMELLGVIVALEALSVLVR